MSEEFVPEYANFRNKLKPSANSAILQNPDKYTTHDLNGGKSVDAPVAAPAPVPKTAPAPAAAAPAPGPPPPPAGPPPPPPPAPSASSGGEATEDAAAALFASINAMGEGGIRSGLKKATKGPVNEDVPVAAPKAVKKEEKKPAAVAAKPPKCSLVGKKWEIEYQEGNKECVIEVTDMKHTVYIFKCNKSVIQIKGKCNSLSIDSCSKVDVVFENALSQCEIMNSKDIRVQCTGNAPSINLDNCVAVTYYMSAESVESAHIITAKCAAVNIIRPKPEDPDDILETPIPEQFLTTFKNGQWVTEMVSHDD
mmetsp:Transcript_5395/g.9499  ORF Transcript_5395/g.9499 Transcript_5395/m.9499 type:complete len:309 (+) Transcript_5395:86-1012(+)